MLELGWFVVADFGFAILPWFVIWDLNMKRKEKITVAVGLSLGVLYVPSQVFRLFKLPTNVHHSAGICGIVRTVALDGLNATEYIRMFQSNPTTHVIRSRLTIE